MLHALKGDDAGRAGLLVPEHDEAEDEGGGKLLACAVCRSPITTWAARIEIDGGHEHTFTNPDGIRFRIGCFREVQGCVGVGRPTAAFTWFAGYTWQIEHCGTCALHLGWRYRAPGHGFHGLIVNRLVEEDDAGS
jgi:hypothetical protein